MAIVNLDFDDCGTSDALEYAHRDKEQGGLVSAVNCSTDLEKATEEFASVQQLHNWKGKNDVIRIIQSWNPEESKNLKPEEVNMMGLKLVSEKFKDHQIHVGTHVDTDCYHNHIVVNAVSMSGKRILNQDPNKLWRQLCTINDAIAVENGLSVPNKEAKERRANMPEIAKQIARHNKQSFIIDLSVKADWARKIATNYDQYVSYLSVHNIQAHVENKSIRYLYPGMKRWKRGDTLGKNYDKKRLEEQFKKNDELFAKNPKLREALIAEMPNSKDQKNIKGHKLSDYIYEQDNKAPSHQKDYNEFTYVPRRKQSLEHPSIKALGGIVDFDQLKNARNQSIIEYCNKNKIALMHDKKGNLVLKNREYIQVSDLEWINNKGSHTRGNIIDFVANHKKMTFFQAIAHINNTPELLKVEQALGEQKRTFYSFYVPKQESADIKTSHGKLSSFLKSSGADSSHAHSLLKDKQAQVDHKGVIKLFELGEPEGSLDFTQQQTGQWTRSKRGKFNNAFYFSRGSSHKAHVFSDPIQLLQAKGKGLFSNKNDKDGILGLMEPNHGIVERYLAQHPHVQHLSFISLNKDKMTKVELDFFNNLKNHFGSHGIKVEPMSIENVRSHHGPDLSI